MNRRASRARQIVSNAVLATFWLLVTSSAFGDAVGTQVLLNSYDVTSTISEGQAISIALEYRISPTDETGFGGTTTHRLTSNSVTHTISGPLGGTAVTSDPDTDIVHTASTTFTILQDGDYTVSFDDAVPIYVVEVKGFDLPGTFEFNETRALSASRSVTVTNVAPTIVSALLNGTNGNITVPEGSTVTFQASSTDPGADAQTFTISGTPGGPYVSTDSATSGTRTSALSSELFADDGVFNVNFNVADDDTSVDVGRTLTVQNVGPTITSISLSGTYSPNAAIPFTASATDPGVNDVLTFSWDFDGDNVIDLVDVVGSGGSGTSAGTIPAFFFPSPPENPGFTVYNGVLTVDDGDGGVDTVNFSLTIIPEPSSFVMAGFAAVAGLLALRRRRRNA